MILNQFCRQSKKKHIFFSFLSSLALLLASISPFARAPDDAPEPSPPALLSLSHCRIYLSHGHRARATLATLPPPRSNLYLTISLSLCFSFKGWRRQGKTRPEPHHHGEGWRRSLMVKVTRPAIVAVGVVVRQSQWWCGGGG
ncbi:Uncharacterized protein Rs2_40155 [Raphanus sativus]|nr:Uncharacterized protein Rs2_40155 [Raphanus sativus]